MRTRDRVGWMLSGALLTIFVLFGCNVVQPSQPAAPTVGQVQAQGPQQGGEQQELPPDATPVQGQQQPGTAPGADPLAEIVNAVYQKVNPSVVLITVQSQGGGGLGTGFVIDNQGHIVTNYHVVAGSGGEVIVTFRNLEDYVGEVIGADQDADLAVVRVRDIDPSQLVPVELGDSSQVRVGQMAVAIGNPLGEERTVTQGIISAVRAAKRESSEPGTFSIPGVIQTDAAINPGNSGGPLLDAQGRVIGVNTFIANPGGVGGNVGIGFAVPVNLVKKVVPALIEQGRYVHPYLGVLMATVSRLDAQQNNLPSKGALITDFAQGASPARDAGLEAGDIIRAINSQAIITSDDVISFLEFNTRPGDTVTFSVIGRNGQEREVQLQVGERPSR